MSGLLRANLEALRPIQTFESAYRMSFHIQFNSDFTPVDADRLNLIKPRTHRRCGIVLGSARQVGFVWSEDRHKSPTGNQALFAKIGHRYSLVGRARLDARGDICTALCTSNRRIAEISDPLLCLQAYARWGDRFIEHLKGDFCFAIWDEDRQQLTIARDQLGIRPLFYSCTASNWHISDSLENIAVMENSIELDDYWIADFLSIGYSLDVDRTVYKHIMRVPPACTVVISDTGSSIRKYWTLDIDEPVYYRKSSDYIEHFDEVFGLAISDRLPPDRVGISMSGGLDSTTLAAHTLKTAGNSSRLIAFCRYFDSLIPDQEKYFSSLVAKKLGIELIHRAVDHLWYDPNWHTHNLRTPEPHLSIASAIPQHQVTDEMSRLSEVWFYGEGPDNALLFEWQPYMGWLVGRSDWNGLIHAMVHYVRDKQLKEWRATIRRALRCTTGERDAANMLDWLSMTFVKDLDLTDRFRQSGEQIGSNHPWHPRAMASFNSSIWPSFLEDFDPAITKTKLDWRHPYLDVRVLTFLLSVPPVPWARRKRLLRDAMRGVLPDEVINRDKAPLVGDPTAVAMQKSSLPQLDPKAAIWQYIDARKFRDAELSDITSSQLLKIHVLDAWLNSRRPNRQ